MVGGLIEEQQIGLGEQESTQGDTTTLATGQGGHVSIRRWETEGVHRDLERPFELPGAEGVDSGLEFGLLTEQCVEVGIRISEGCTDFFKALEEITLFGNTIGHVADHIFGGVEFWFLGEVANSEARSEPSLTSEAVIEARHDAQQ